MSLAGISLVTGGGGFIGRHLVTALSDQGKPVRVLDLKPNSQELPPQVEILAGSILDQDLLDQAMQGVSTVYHLAAIPHLWIPDTADYHKVNVLGTRCVLEAAGRVKPDRFVYTSSETVLRGWRNRSQLAVDESEPLPKPDEMPGPYSRSKLLAELEVRKAIGQGLPGMVVYPTVPIGPGDDNMTPPARMIRDFLKGKNPAYLECSLNLVPVQSVAEGHILAAEKGQVGERYILGQDNYKLSEILLLVEQLSGIKMPVSRVNYTTALLTARAMEFGARISGKTPAASLEGVRLAGTGFTFNNSKAQKELGLPQYSIQQALQDTIRWMLNM